jgi:four helix bundle protein
MVIKTFRDLTVWQKAMQLATDVYRASEQLPRSESYGLSSQMRRAAVSIAANIAEGKAVGGRNYARHLKLAIGSESELQTHIELARRLTMFNSEQARALIEQTAEVGRMLASLLKALPKD